VSASRVRRTSRTRIKPTHCCCRTADDVYLVPRSEVTLTAQRAVDFSRRLSSVKWSTGDGVRIARGDEGRQAQADAFNRGALGAAAQLIGLAQQMVDVTVDYVGQREQFGKVVGSFQAVKHHMSNALLAVEFARPMVYVAAYAVANATPHRDREVSAAKAMASDAADRVCRLALQCPRRNRLHVRVRPASVDEAGVGVVDGVGRRTVPPGPRGHGPRSLTVCAYRRQWESWLVACVNCAAANTASVERCVPRRDSQLSHVSA
jgi:hypothetical protein